MATCKYCGASIVWAETENGKRMPVDSEPQRFGGNVRLELDQRPPRATVLSGDRLAEARADGESIHLAHFATCANNRRKR